MSIAIQADSNLPQGYILVNGTAAATVRQDGTIVAPTLSATSANIITLRATTVNTTTLSATGNISTTGTTSVSGIIFNDSSTQTSAPIGSLVQSWQVVTGSRAAGITYTNTTNRPIMVNVQSQAAINASCTLYVNSVQVAQATCSNLYVHSSTMSAIVPPGQTYSVTGTFTSWAELR